ncbi:unnamed protein product [Allacma fusca]|uniref:Uncharacterized protein n=1 Tax=Allacma fusca TaxID=39272 RepID=A0A8J2K813_9HEXA|nr:unnamed protein product [Allacma fusca]
MMWRNVTRVILTEIAKRAPPHTSMKMMMDDIKIGQNSEIVTKAKLPQERNQPEGWEFGLNEPAKVPVGKITFRKMLELLANHEVEPETFTAEKLAKDCTIVKMAEIPDTMGLTGSVDGPGRIFNSILSAEIASISPVGNEMLSELWGDGQLEYLEPLGDNRELSPPPQKAAAGGQEKSREKLCSNEAHPEEEVSLFSGELHVLNSVL